MNRPGREYCEAVIRSLEREIAALKKENFRLLNDVQWPYAQQAVIEAALEGRLPKLDESPLPEWGDPLARCYCGNDALFNGLCGMHQ